MHAQDNDVACCAAQVGAITGSKILRIMKGLGLAPEIPEDLYHLIKKAVSMRKHLELNRKDKDGKFRLILVESRIHRLARYYKVLMRRHHCPCVLSVPHAVSSQVAAADASVRDWQSIHLFTFCS